MVTGFTRTVSFSQHRPQGEELVGITGKVKHFDLRVTVMKCYERDVR